MNIEIKQLNKAFGDNKVFTDFNLVLDKQVVAVSGESGCGKTTLLRMIAGLTDYSGSIENVPEKLSYVFQEDRLLPWKTVCENLAFVGKDIEPSKLNELIESVLNKLGLSDTRDMLPDKLSGGMQRRVALGRAYIYDSELILMDEPFKGLNPEMKHKIADEFLEMIRASNKSVVIVTHDDDIIAKADERIQIN
ncbi:MAG: ATP-binding cassette domain-containing protein [Kiritimatiellae bacterium]|jgi:NitT/TauT family transport system ATP-binding protein|nr:ATP-binding cassette domain-containing protein [Kiritimatiellia bacterium]